MLTKPFAFVIMPFGVGFQDTYLLGIKPACEDAGYYCERLDEQIFDETMLERIYNQIAKADLVVADLSERNPNVFYETGYAHALGKRVILLTRNPDDIPFDLKHHFHIVYTDGIAGLKNRLRERAAYYVTHPNTTTRSPFDQLALLLNGKPVDWTATTVSLNTPFKLSMQSEQGTCIDAAFHLLENALETQLDIDVRLITTATFPQSGWEISHGSREIYTTIAMPDGRLMHKPLHPLRVALGDPDKVVFDLYKERPSGAIDGTYPMTLRIISCGLRRDILLDVTITMR